MGLEHEPEGKRDESSAQDISKLRLVKSPDAYDLRRQAALEAIATREFNCGSFDALLLQRESLLKDSLDVPGIEDPEQKVEHVTQKIREVLREEGCFLAFDKLAGDDLKTIGSQKAMNQGLIDFMLESDRPDLPAENIRRHVLELGRKLFSDSDWRTTREGLERSLLERHDIRIRNSDLTRLLLHEINKSRLAPEVLVLPNRNKPYNPFLVILTGARGLPAEESVVLSLFAR